MNKLKLALVSAVVASVLSPAVMAHQQGDFIIRAGATNVNPNDDSGKVSVDGLGTTGMEVGVDDNTQLGLNFLYMLTDNWGVELLASTPFKHDIHLQQSELGLGDGMLADTKQLPPTLSAMYFFDTGTKFHPYVAAGINYTFFFEDNFVDSRNAQGFNSLSLDNSLSWAVQAGFDYMLDDNWMFNMSYRYIDIETDASFKVGEAAASVDVDVDPGILTIALGYKF